MYLFLCCLTATAGGVICWTVGQCYMMDSGTVLYDGQWDSVICWTVGQCYMMDSGTVLYVGQWDSVI